MKCLQIIKLLSLLVLPCLIACGHKPPPVETRLLVSTPSPHAQMGPGIDAAKEGDRAEAADRTGKAPFQDLASLRSRVGLEEMSVLRELPFSKTKNVRVAVDRMKLTEFIHHIFTDIFSVNYVIDNEIERLDESVTLNLKQEVSEYRLFELVSDVLKQHEISIYSKNEIYYLMLKPKFREIAVGIGSSLKDIPVTAGEIRQIVPIKYAESQNLHNFLPRIPDVKVMPVSEENAFVVTGGRNQVEQVVRLVNILDRPAMRGRYVGLVQLTYWGPAEMIKKLSEIFKQEGIPLSYQAGRKGVFLTGLERWRSIIVFAAEKDWLERVKYWVKLLDIPIEGDERRYFLYFPQNCKASELGESLESMLGIAQSGSAYAGGVKTTESDKKKEKSSEKKDQAGRGAIETRLRNVTGDVSFAVDKNRNVLIIYAAPGEYKKLESLLKQLDVMPLQVLIEATIAEVTLRDELQYGLEWYLKNTDGSQTSVLGTLGGLELLSGGFDFSLVTDSEKFSLLIKALAKENVVKIISSPRITVRDGKAASFIVGTEVPVITSESSSSDIVEEGTSGILRSVEYRDTGVTLEVTPSVHAQGVVTLEIRAEESEAQTNALSDISSPVILNRTVSSEVVARDGQTVLVAGLIRENISNTVNKVPILGDIPYMGNLFKTSSDSTDRTELVIMITPHIVRNTGQIDEIRGAIFKTFDYLYMEGLQEGPRGSD